MIKALFLYILSQSPFKIVSEFTSADQDMLELCHSYRQTINIKHPAILTSGLSTCFAGSEKQCFHKIVNFSFLTISITFLICLGVLCSSVSLAIV